MLLRETSGENLDGLSQWWTDYQNADENQRSELQKPGDDAESAPRKRRRRRKPRKPESELLSLRLG